MKQNNNSVDISVILCLYNASEAEIKITLNSIVMQESCSWELLICDDGSNILHKSVIDDYLYEVKGNATCIYNSINMGTVNNILSGINCAKGKYIKPIGQGDYFTQKNSLKEMVSFMEQNSYYVAFSDMEYFKYVNGEKHVIDNIKGLPIDKGCYLKKSKKRIMENMFYNGDYICGCAAFYERSTLLKYLKKMRGKVIYCEDFSIQLYALDDYDIGFYCKKLVAYEISNGISKNNVKICKDTDGITNIMQETYSNNIYVRFRTNYEKMLHSKKYIINRSRFLYRIIICPRSLKYILHRKYANNI